MADLVLVVTVKAHADVVGKLKPAMLENAAQSVNVAAKTQFGSLAAADANASRSVCSPI